MNPQQPTIDCYDRTARQYADKFGRETEHKHFDRLVLRSFAQDHHARGPMLDAGCGPGQTTAFLAGCGVQELVAVDISPAMVAVAREWHPQLSFRVGDLLALDFADNFFGSAVAFYAIVHFTPPQLRQALQEIYRVLKPGGEFVFSFHVGEETVHYDEFLGVPVSIDFRFFLPEDVTALLAEVGFTLVDAVERQPYPAVEYPSRRAYLWACKPETGVR